MQTLHFGNHFDGKVHSGAHGPATFYCGEKTLLRWLETHLGLSGHPENTDYLRIELYRQALSQRLAAEPGAFFAASFDADRFATATALLAWRDELLLGGWDFSPKNTLPSRLLTLAETEQIFRKKLAGPPASVQAVGFADRFEAALKALDQRILPLEKMVLHEPQHLQPPHIQRFIKKIGAKGVAIEQALDLGQQPLESDLGWLQKRISGNESGKKNNSEADGSLVVIRCARDADAAVFLAQLLARNPGFRPTILLPELSLTLEQAMMQEGLPAMGILSASLARPTLQVLKLAPAMLWEPVDIMKIMEFVTLPVKPLDDGLAMTIARVLAEKPGLSNDIWFAAVFGYLENENVPEEARKQYEFWFDRRRYKSESTAPKRDVIGIYAYLQEWAAVHFEKTGGKNTSLLVLAEQARRIRELLEAIPETRLTFLELERIVRTIYEPSPVQFVAAERQRLDFVHSPGAFSAQPDAIVWWNCHFSETAPEPMKWSPDERQLLENEGVVLSFPKTKVDRRTLLSARPVLAAGQRLILIVPDLADGKAAEPSLLLGDLDAGFEHPENLFFDIDRAPDRKKLGQVLTTPGFDFYKNRPVGMHQPLLPLARPDLISESEYETPTNLESLFYFPHKWFFKQKMRLYPANILTVTGDVTLLGNLSHRFFEMMLKEDFRDWNKATVGDWIDGKSDNLLKTEGATLLMYGREPEKRQFLNRVKNAAWSLVSLLKSNDWEVLHTEFDLSGDFDGVPVRGKADLVLGRGDERAIVDLKWSGANRRREMIKNQEDLQLVLYAKLLPPTEKWAHTAYFILEDGKMIARNAQAFRESIVAGPGDDHQLVNEMIWEKMLRTYRWRLSQLRNGQLEIRNNRNLPELEAIYAEILGDLLEMKQEEAKWDAYRGLVGM